MSARVVNTYILPLLQNTAVFQIDRGSCDAESILAVEDWSSFLVDLLAHIEDAQEVCELPVLVVVESVMAVIFRVMYNIARNYEAKFVDMAT